MAKVFISEYSILGRDEKGMSLEAAKEPSLATQTVAIGGTSAQSAAFTSETKFVRIAADAVCSIAFGQNPTADVNSMRISANLPEYFAVAAGHKVAVITNT